MASHKRSFDQQKMFWYACILMAGCLLSACAPKRPLPRPAGTDLWQKFQRHQASLTPLHSFSIRASINYTSTTQKHRVIMRLYGTLEYPIRMDLQAGIGRTISIWREDASRWQGYFPEENRIYLARDGKTGARCLGFPTPFDLRELALILQGDITSVLTPDLIPERVDGQGRYFHFSPDSRISGILLDENGRTRELYGKKGWRVGFDYEGSSAYSQKINIVMDNATQAVVRIKAIREQTFATDLSISLAEQTQTIRLDATTTPCTP